MTIRYLDREWEPLPTSASTAGNPILDFALQRGWVDSSGKVVGDNARNIYDAAKQYGVTGTELDQALGWDSGTANAYATSRGWDALQSPRDSLAAQLRAQYNTGAGGSGSWDDAGYDRAKELADLMVKAGVTNLGDLSFKKYTIGNVSAPLSELVAKGAYQDTSIDGFGNTTSQWYYKDGTPLQLFGGEDGGEVYGFDQDLEATGRQLMIGDKAVGYLGDYNNDGTFGNKADTILHGVGDEALLGWSARGRGNTSYRVVTDPTTGKLVITPGWNSSSDAADFRKAGIFLAGAALGGAGISGSLAGAAGLAGTSGGAALSGAATGAGLNMATTQKIDENTLKAGAIGGLGGYLGYVGGDLVSSLTPGNTGADSLIGGGTDVILDAAGNPVPLNMAAIESGLGTPGYGFNASAATSGLYDPAVIGSGAGLMYGPGGAIIPYDPAAVSAMTANDAIKPVNTKPASEWTDAEWDEYLNSSDQNLKATTNAPVTSETVDVTGQRIPPVNAGGAIGAGISATLPATTDLTEVTDRPPDDDLIDTGDGDDVLDGDGNDTITTPDWGDAIKDWILKNPKLAVTLAGSLLGNVGGDNTNPPPVPGTGPQANLTATPAASLGRRYVAPPPGYRPGIDPEHRYFTGIGAVGTGG